MLHSLIIFGCIFNEDFRNIVYSFTGYVPRGPGWLRSPGTTISFNSTNIVHLSGLYFLVFDDDVDWSRLKKVIVGLIILSSMVFLGRTITFVGLGLIGIIGVLKRNTWIIATIMIVLITVPLSFKYLENNNNIMKHDPMVQLALLNFKKVISPFAGYNKKTSIENYFSKDNGALSSHYYISGNWMTVLFGNSRAGHVGLKEGGLNGNGGETDSDIGLINSINANGIIVTILIYCFYISLIIITRKRSYMDITYVVLLTLVLTFKETGFLTSHASPLLFILLLYQLSPYQNKFREDRVLT
ncbi:hypothetical protein N9Q63_00910 [bacterium]|nr:hypothetical protein [bacterium]